MKYRLTLLALTLTIIMVLSSFFNITEAANPTSNQYSIEQATSEQAQLNTLAFSGLGFLTGDLCSDSFLPPGKVADFFGFQYLRDTTQEGMGHSTDFVTNAANNVLYILSNSQKVKMIDLAKEQVSLVNEFASMRYPLMVAFRRQLNANLPNGSSSLSLISIANYSSSLYAIDGKITIQRAKVFAEIINSLNDTQKNYLNNMVAGGFASWASLPNQVTQAPLTNNENVLVMTYASEMFGWYAGNVEADTYFCPERQADYFGGFFMKDAPAIGKAGYTIDEAITGNKGEAFIAALDNTQKPLITSLVDSCSDYITEIVETRRAISTELRTALIGGTINELRILSLESTYGALDGKISYNYAMAFTEVGKTISEEQQNALMSIRGLNDYTCENGTIYLYSEKITLPEIPNTDFLFNITSQPTEQTSSTGATEDPSPNELLRPLQKSFLDQNQIVIFMIALAVALTAVTLITNKIKQLKQKNTSHMEGN